MAPKKGQVNKNLPVGIINPRITEKASFLGEKNIYIFNVELGTTKSEIKKAFQVLYKVVPVKVAVINKAVTEIVVRGRPGLTKKTRKAMIFLKKGDKIELM